ncbi:DUF2721 domain-containing protein [Nordella sp. HKS 07]|uniref:DUF2721 domain-containing protein n=1 Tax=Nordella sp. HKS 07 TaxID=2712222 RepID=UPI0013E12299|nr:DUF2721 domain-containing protein [Nordella sp. HKS 07]QIG49112.1 DUF2721 domain-containing protein [Nordella sp. HKS 07]
MPVEPGTADHLAQVLSHVIAPSFLLGAVAGFVSIMFTRMTHILDRLRNLNAIPDQGDTRSPLKADIPRLGRRARLMNKAIFLSVCSGIVATLLIVLAFASAYVGIQHIWGAAILFMVSLLLLGAALVVFAIEVRIALADYDHH